MVRIAWVCVDFTKRAYLAFRLRILLFPDPERTFWGGSQISRAAKPVKGQFNPPLLFFFFSSSRMTQQLGKPFFFFFLSTTGPQLKKLENVFFRRLLGVERIDIHEIARWPYPLRIGGEKRVLPWVAGCFFLSPVVAMRAGRAPSAI